MDPSLRKEPKRESREYSGSRCSCRGTGERVGMGRAPAGVAGLGTTLGPQRMCFHLQGRQAMGTARGVQVAMGSVRVGG